MLCRFLFACVIALSIGLPVFANTQGIGAACIPRDACLAGHIAAQ